SAGRAAGPGPRASRSRRRGRSGGRRGFGSFVGTFGARQPTHDRCAARKKVRATRGAPPADQSLGTLRGVPTERMARTLEPAARAPARCGSSAVDGNDALIAAALAARDVGSADAAALSQRLVDAALQSPSVARAWVLVRHETGEGFVEAA